MDPLMDEFQRKIKKRCRWASLVVLLLLALTHVGTAAAVSGGVTAGPCNSATWPVGAPAAAWKGTLQGSLADAAPGSVIKVPPAAYVGQTVTYAGSPVGCAYVDATGATFESLEMDGAQHVYLRGATITRLWNLRPSTGNSWNARSEPPRDLVFDGLDAKTFLWRNAVDVTLRDSRVGGWDASVTPLGPPKIGAYPPSDGSTQQLSTDVLIDGVFFHDMIRTQTGTAHAECFYFDAGVDGLTIRGSTFTNCAVFDIFSNGGTAGRPITNVLIENNLLDVSRDGSGGGAGSTVNLKGGASNWTFRGNSILGQGGTLRNDTAGYPGFVFERNAIQNASFGWIGSATWTGNVMSAPAPGQQQAKPVGFVSASIARCDLSACYRNDLHVIADSPAGRAGAGVPVADSPPPPPPEECPTEPGVPVLQLTVVAQDATTITYGWAPVSGAIGYRFNSTALGAKWPHTWDAGRSTVKFAKGSKCYRVGALLPGPTGTVAGQTG